MKFFRCFSPWKQRLVLFVSLSLVGMASVVAQTPSIVITTLPNNVYKIGTTNLDPEDLVFYKFSDGFDMSAMKTTVNTEASVQRQFKSLGASVTAFIAEKNGGLGIATATLSNPTCSNCALPYIGLVNGEYLRLRNTSWDAFVDPANPAALLDNKADPNYYTPTVPWFILPVTMKGPQANAYSEINIPPGMTITGAVVKGIYKQLGINSNPFTITDNEVASFLYDTPGKIRINLTSSFNVEFNVYFIVRSSTTVGQSSSFSAQMYSSGGSPVGSLSQIKVVTHQNPHDPNLLTAYQPYSCWLETDQPPFDFRVDFQNLGAGLAEIVKVRVAFNTQALDPYSVTAGSVTSSFPLTVLNTEPTAVTFTFKPINLPGLDQDPQPAIETTKGWVKFSIEAQPCISQSLPNFKTNAQVTFFGNGGNFNETIATNETTTPFSECYPADPLCPDRAAFTELNAIKALKCYPTLFDNLLQVDAPAFRTNSVVAIAIQDLAGKIWLQQEFPVDAGSETRHALNTTSLPAGMYLVHVRAGKDVTVFKVIKE